MEMNSRALRALALLGALLAGSTTVHASETLNTILGGGAGGVAGTMIGKELGGDTGALVGAALATRMKRPLAALWGRWAVPLSARVLVAIPAS